MCGHGVFERQCQNTARLSTGLAMDVACDESCRVTTVPTNIIYDVICDWCMAYPSQPVTNSILDAPYQHELGEATLAILLRHYETVSAQETAAFHADLQASQDKDRLAVQILSGMQQQEAERRREWRSQQRIRAQEQAWVDSVVAARAAANARGLAASAVPPETDCIAYYFGIDDIIPLRPYLGPFYAPDAELCSICHEDLALPPFNSGVPADPRQLPCGHIMHFQCIRKWFESCTQRNSQHDPRIHHTCPLCRLIVDVREQPSFKDEVVEGEETAQMRVEYYAAHPEEDVGGR